MSFVDYFGESAFSRKKITWCLTFCSVLLAQELLVKVDVFQQAVLRQSLVRSFWSALKQSERGRAAHKHCGGNENNLLMDAKPSGIGQRNSSGAASGNSSAHQPSVGRWED